MLTYVPMVNTITRRCDPDREQRIIRHYTKDHLTLREIGRLEQVSAVAVFKVLKRHGIHRTDGTWVQTTCGHCHAPITVKRAVWRKRQHSYCDTDCYFAKRKNPKYFQSRHGQRKARLAVRAAGFPLLKSHVVHHHDGDNRNNAIQNLAVFESQRDHMRFHHTGQPDPIWDGRNHAA